jgi:hypothetical protein
MASKETCIESQLFDVQGGWDGDHESMIFYDAISKVTIGDFPVGTKFDTVIFDNSSSVLQLFVGDGESQTLRAEFELKLSVGNKISK